MHNIWKENTSIVWQEDSRQVLKILPSLSSVQLQTFLYKLEFAKDSGGGRERTGKLPPTQISPSSTYGLQQANAPPLPSDFTALKIKMHHKTMLNPQQAKGGGQISYIYK